MMAPRLLPFTIAACGLLLVSKVLTVGGAFWPATLPASVGVVTPAQAAPAPAPASAPAPNSPAVPPPPPRPAYSRAAAPAAAAAVVVPPSEPPVSDAEKQLLQDLRTRRLELDARERVLGQRQEVLDAAEQRLASRVAELTALQTRLEQLETERRAHDEANWAGLVKVYETMKPRDAAGIFNDMDMPVLLQVVDRMKDSKVAPVLAAMQPDRARLLTTQLAAQRTRSITVPNAG